MSGSATLVDMKLRTMAALVVGVLLLAVAYTVVDRQTSLSPRAIATFDPERRRLKPTTRDAAWVIVGWKWTASGRATMRWTVVGPSGTGGGTTSRDHPDEVLLQVRQGDTVRTAVESWAGRGLTECWVRRVGEELPLREPNHVIRTGAGPVMCSRVVDWQG